MKSFKASATRVCVMQSPGCHLTPWRSESPRGQKLSANADDHAARRTLASEHHRGQLSAVESEALLRPALPPNDPLISANPQKGSPVPRPDAQPPRGKFGLSMASRDHWRPETNKRIWYPPRQSPYAKS